MTCKLPFVSVLAAALAAAGAPASRASAETCVFNEYAPSVVTPYVADTVLDYATYSYLGGVQLFVPAREGLTQEWLAASVQKALAHSAERHAHGASAKCSGPGLRDINVSVVSGGTGFWVRLLGRDYEDSRRLLRWANGLVASQNATRVTSR